MGFLIRSVILIIINAFALIIVSELFESFHIANFRTAILASVVIALLNLIVKPILILFTLPATILTLGLFLFVINAFILMLAESIIGDMFVINGFGMALLASIIISIINTLFSKVVD